MLAVTVSQVVALLSSALSGTEDDGGGSVAIGTTTKAAAGADQGERWRRCGGQGHDHSAASPGYCCVCISACRDGDDIRRLPCGHAFHRDCVDRWLRRAAAGRARSVACTSPDLPRVSSSSSRSARTSSSGSLRSLSPACSYKDSPP